MRQKSGKMICSLCGGQLEQKRVRVVRERHEQPVLFEKVPAKVCPKCGHRWFGLPVVREMRVKTTLTERIIKEGEILWLNPNLLT